MATVRTTASKIIIHARSCCRHRIEVQRFLDRHRQNVVSIHCWQGSDGARHLLVARLLESATAPRPRSTSLAHGQNNKGVTIPSQKRYVEYAAACLRKELPGR